MRPASPGSPKSGAALLLAAAVGCAVVTVRGDVEPSTGSAPAAPDLVLHGGALYTVDPERPWAEAVAIEDGRITAVGSSTEILGLAGEGTERLDLGGRMVLPGIHDPHIHLLEAGVNRGLCFLRPGRGLAFYERAMRQCARQQSGAAWVRAAGPFAEDLLVGQGERPLDVLDRAVPDRPAYVLGALGHSVWVNSRALAAAGLGPASPDPRGGILDRDTNTGELTGVLFEAAQYLVYDAAEPPTAENLEEAYRGLQHGMRTANRFGITSVSDAGGYWTRGHDEVWKRAQREGTLTVRASNALFVYPYLPVGAQVRELVSRFSDDRESLLRFNQAKIYVDGIPSLGTAALFRTYRGFPEAGNGFLYFTSGRLRRYAKRLQRAGFQLHFHATGDRSARLALTAIERTRRGHRGRRNRITHLFLVQPEDRSRFAGLGVVADQQMSADAVSAQYEEFLKDFIGDETLEPLPTRALLDAGARVVLSSDWDAGRISPFGTLQRGLTRPRNALPDLAAGLRMATLDGAFLLHQERRVGSIEVGKLADLIVLDRNLFEVEVDEIGGTRVLLTLLEGREVYRRPGF